MEELKNTYGSSSGMDYQSKIETIDNSYAFLKFGRLTFTLTILITYFIEKVITKKRKEYRDSNTKENLDRLNQELLDVSKIMSENFEMIFNRGKNMKQLSSLSTTLREDASKVT